jgi:hypothetical protein
VPTASVIGRWGSAGTAQRPEGAAAYLFPVAEAYKPIWRTPHINSAGVLRRPARIGVQVELAFAPTMRLTVLNRPKVLRAIRSMRVAITMSSGGTPESSAPNSTKTAGHRNNHVGFAATNLLGT